MHSPTVFAAIGGLLSLLLNPLPAFAVEVTMRARDSSLTIVGEFISSVNGALIIGVTDVGNLTLDSSEFACVSGPCEDAGELPAAALKLSGPPQTTTWIGDSALGTEALPRLIKAYGDSVGATVVMKVGRDPRNLEFTLSGGNGQLLGRVNVNRQGDQHALEALAKSEADIVWTSSPPVADESQTTASIDPGGTQPLPQRYALGQDVLVVMVAKDNPAHSLSLDDVAKIFAGQIKDWSVLGLTPGKINVYAPSGEMGTWTAFDSLVLKPRGLTVTGDAIRLLHATEWSDRVAADRNGIGIGSMAFLRKSRALNVALPCGIVLQPSPFSAKAGEYPLTDEIHLNTGAELKNPFAAALLAFALSPRAQQILDEAHFVKREQAMVYFDGQAPRVTAVPNVAYGEAGEALMFQLIRNVHEAHRVSTTFHFNSTDTTLDDRDRADLARLARLAASPEAAGKSIMLLGFSDSTGNYQANLRVADRRAAKVHDALVKLVGSSLPANTSISHAAYGAVAPVACNDTAGGRALNRRVEVWVK